MKFTFAPLQFTFLIGLLTSIYPAKAEVPEKVTTMPQVEQFALGKGGTGLPDDGLEYCGPTAMTMNVAWLGLAGHSRLAPTTAAGQTPDFFINLDRTLGGLMEASAYDGTLAGGVKTGMEIYLKMKGYEGNYTAATGGIWGPTGDGSGTGTGATIPTLNDLTTVANNTSTDLHFGTFVVGWYDTTSAVWQRDGGHFLTILATSSTDNTVTINNPYPNTGMTVQQTINLTNVPAGTQANAGDSFNYDIGGALNASEGMQYAPGGTMPTGYPTPVIEQWLDFTVPITIPGVATWHLDQGTSSTDNLISIGLGHQEVLAPVADSLNGASAFNFYGGGLLTFTQEATYSGGTTVTDSTLVSTVKTGTPFGTGDIFLSQSTLALRPTGSGENVTLSTGGTFGFGVASQLELDLGDHTSLTFEAHDLHRNGNSTLTIATKGANAVLGQNVKFRLTTDLPEVSGGMVSPAVLGQADDGSQSGFFLTYDAADGFKAAATTSGDINTLTGAPIYEATSAQTVNSGTTVDLTALAVNNTTVTGATGTAINLGTPAGTGAGIILNGGTVSVDTVNFGNQEAFIYASASNGTIASTLQGSASLNTFGPGTVTLSGNVAQTGETRVLSGTTLLTGTVTASSGVYVEYGATLEQHGTVGSSTQSVPVTISGLRRGSGNIYGDVTVDASGTFEGTGTITGTTTIYGRITNNQTSPNPAIPLTFEGNVTIENGGEYYWSLNSITELSLNPYITVNGTLTLADGMQIGLLFNTADDPSTGNTFWDTDKVFLIAKATHISAGEDFITLNELSYANGYFQYNYTREELSLYWTATPIPEPSTWALLGLGVLTSMGALRRRRLG